MDETEVIKIAQGLIVDFKSKSDIMVDFCNTVIKALKQQKTGHWTKISSAEIYECSECGRNVLTGNILAYKFCHGCGAKMIKPQEKVRNKE